LSPTTARRKATCSTLPASTRIETLADDQNFTFRGTEAFTAAGQINWFTNGTDTFLQFNTNADLNAEGIIQLNGVINGDAVLMFL
jgi:hypothetical protein